MKKWLCLGLAALMLLTTGCGNNSGVNADVPEDLSPEVIGDCGGLQLPIDTNNTELKMLVTSNNFEVNDSVVLKELRRRTGVNLQVQPVASESADQKIRVLIASKTNMPDIVGGTLSRAELNDMGVQGAFEPINNHFDELPNFSEMFFENPEKYNAVDKLLVYYATDGNMYCFPSYLPGRDVNHGMLYRKDIFDKHGIKMWNNTEEFIEVLRQLKKLYPDSYPFSTKNKTSMISTFAAQTSNIIPFQVFFDEEAHEWKLGPLEKEFRELLDFLRTLYTEGLIHPEFLTMSEAAWTAEMVQPYKTFVTWDWIGRLDQITKDGQATKADFDLRYGNPLEGQIQQPQGVSMGPAVKKTKNSVIALKLLDYLLSPSGAELMSMGIEGVTYNFTDEGKVEYVGFEGKHPQITELDEAFGLFVSGLYRRWDKRSGYFVYSEREQEAQDIILAKEDPFYPADPEVVLDEEIVTEIALIQVDMAKAAEEFAVKYILADSVSEKDWEAFYKSFKKFDTERVLREYNKALEKYDARKAK